MLSNVFEVSVDFLLKDEKTEKSADEKGYYVNREMAVGYIANEKKTCKYFGAGCASFALAGIPYIAFYKTPGMGLLLGISLFILAGIIAIVISMFTSKDEYKILKREPLLFDYDFLKGLTAQYHSLKKKYMVVSIVCTILFVVDLLILAVTVRGIFQWTNYHIFVFLALAVGVFGVVYSAGATEAYEVLVHNDNYSNGVWFKLKRKARAKLDDK